MPREVCPGLRPRHPAPAPGLHGPSPILPGLPTRERYIVAIGVLTSTCSRAILQPRASAVTGDCGATAVSSSSAEPRSLGPANAGRTRETILNCALTVGPSCRGLLGAPNSAAIHQWSTCCTGRGSKPVPPGSRRAPGAANSPRWNSPIASLPDPAAGSGRQIGLCLPEPHAGSALLAVARPPAPGLELDSAPARTGGR